MCMTLKNRIYSTLFYLYFIVLGIAFTLVFMPAIELFKSVFPRITNFYFQLTHTFYINLIRMMTAIGAIRVHPFKNEHYLFQHSPCIYVSNHRSMLDVLIFLTKLRSTNCLVKAGPNPRHITGAEETTSRRTSMPGWWLPFIMGSLKILGYIRMPESKRDFTGLKETLVACSRSIRSGRSIIIFPEGTRSPDGRLLPFLTLPFKLACMEKTPIVPIVIHNRTPIMPKGSILINIPHRVDFHVEVLPPVIPDDSIDPQSLLVKVRREMSRALREADKRYGKMEISDDA